jgi:hypothetical protein
MLFNSQIFLFVLLPLLIPLYFAAGLIKGRGLMLCVNLGILFAYKYG